MRRPSRAALRGDILEVAPSLLGSLVVHDTAAGTVAVRLVEVEAYDGANDPGSHAFRGKTARNAAMFEDAGLAYVYFSYGMHWCMNVVCGPTGRASAVLLRAGEVVEGLETARERRGGRTVDRDLARGPARLCQALGVDGNFNGADLLAEQSALRLSVPEAGAPAGHVRRGPRVGLTEAADRPWRFWLDGDPCVSTYRPAVPRGATAHRPVSQVAKASSRVGDR